MSKERFEGRKELSCVAVWWKTAPGGAARSKALKQRVPAVFRLLHRYLGWMSEGQVVENATARVERMI